MSAPAPRADGSSFDRVIDALGDRVIRLDTHRRHADARCPAHDDQRPSLTVDWTSNAAKGGMTLVRCHGPGCDYRDVLAAVGLSPVDAFDTDRDGYSRRPSPPRASRSKPAHTTTAASRGQTSRRRRPLPPLEEEYPYALPSGEVVGWFRRHQGKEFRWQRVAADGSREVGQPSPCPLFLAPSLAPAIEAGTEVHLAEGEKDALALVDAGAVAVSIPNGVAVTQTGTPKGNFTPEHIEAFRGAHVTVWADRDGPDKKNPERGYQGYRNAMYVRDQLLGVAASVRVVEAADGNDAYDHLAAGNELAAAVEIAPEDRVPAKILARWGRDIPASAQAAAPAEELPEPEPADDDTVVRGPWRGRRQADGQDGDRRGGGGGGGHDEGKREVYVRDRYEVYGDALVKVAENSETITRKELINAKVRITRQVLRDLGEAHDAEKLVDLEVTRGGETFTVDSLKWEEFENPQKWVSRIPLGLTFSRGQGRGTVVNAIIATSGVVPVVTAYGMLGWRQLPSGEWVYLHAGGAIGAEGSLLGARVEVSPRLRGFVLPDPPTGDDLRRAYDAVIGIADRLPPHIAYPLIAAGARAPLGDCTANLFAVGRPGTYKSGTAALIQQMWDVSARYNKLPAGAGESAASIPALEQIMYEAGHSFLVVDDLAPDRGVARSAARGAEIIRMVGNRVAKARSTRDSTGLRADKTPRALVVLTGEDQPTVESAERRTIYIKFRKGDVKVAVLKELSAPWMIKARPGITAALAQWAASRMPTTEWLEQQRDLYAEALAEGWDDSDGVVAGRCNNIAELATGFRALLDLVVDAGVVSQEEADQRWQAAWTAFRETLAAQFEMVDRRTLAQRAADLLRSALRAGRAHLQSEDGGMPERAQRFGWLSTKFEARPGGPSAGWVTNDGRFVWLHPGAAFAVIESEGKAQVDELGKSQRALKSALIDDGLLTVEKNPKGGMPREVRRKASGVRERVWELPYTWLYPDDFDDDENDDEDGGGPTENPDSPLPQVPPAGGAAPSSKPAHQHIDTDTHPSEDQDSAEGDEMPAQPPEAAAERPNEARTAAHRPGGPRRRSAPPSALGGDTRGYKAAGVVVDVDAACLVGGAGATVDVPDVDNIGDLVAWASRLHLGIRRPGGPASRANGARDDAGLLVIMPRLARKLGAPAKAPDRDKPAAKRHKLVKLLAADGWTVGERGLQPYTQVWPTAGGPATFLVFPGWIGDEPLFADADDAHMLAYRLALYVAQVGMQLIYTSRSTGAELLKQLRAFTDHPLTVKVGDGDVPPPGRDKAHAPVEDAEWNWTRPPTSEELQEYEYALAVDVNAHYLPAAASVVVGHGQPVHHIDIELPDNLRKTAGYWLIDPPHVDHDPRMPDLWHPSADDRRTGPRWVTTPYLLALREAGSPISRALEAWIYPNPGCHLQVWSHKLRDALYDLDASLQDVDDPDTEAVLASIKLTYAGGIGMLGSERWKKGTELWLPHYRHSTIGLAMANLRRKVNATAAAAGRYPLALVRDTVIYPATSADVADLPLNTSEVRDRVPRGFLLQGKGEPYRVGSVKPDRVASLSDYAAAMAVTDDKARRNALDAIWTDISYRRASGGE